MKNLKSTLLLLLFSLLLANCSKSDQESIQGSWQCTGDKADMFSTMQITGHDILIEFTKKGSKPDIATFTLFEKGDKKWISLVEGSKKAQIKEYRLDGDKLSFYDEDGTLEIEFKR